MGPPVRGQLPGHVFWLPAKPLLICLCEGLTPAGRDSADESSQGGKNKTSELLGDNLREAPVIQPALWDHGTVTQPCQQVTMALVLGLLQFSAPPKGQDRKWLSESSLDHVNKLSFGADPEKQAGLTSRCRVPGAQ